MTEPARLEPSKGAKRATEAIVDWAEAYYQRNVRSHFGGFELAELIDRETKAPEMAWLLHRLTKCKYTNFTVDDEEEIKALRSEAERLLSELEGKG